MELNEAISELFKHGIAEVTFGVNPDTRQSGINAKQFLNAGSVQAVYQHFGDSPEDCYNAVIAKVKHTAQLQENVIKLKNGHR